MCRLVGLNLARDGTVISYELFNKFTTRISHGRDVLFSEGIFSDQVINDRPTLIEGDRPAGVEFLGNDDVTEPIIPLLGYVDESEFEDSTSIDIERELDSPHDTADVYDSLDYLTEPNDDNWIVDDKTGMDMYIG
jgi:hypothetical protein